MLADRRIVLGVTGGIAAYKAVLLCRMLVDAGAHVIPVLTESAQRFVGRATFDALASEPARTSIFDDPDPIPHTTLGQTADLIVVAPATARCIGSYASGISDDLLTATLIATRAPVVVCPAMHTEMWEHPAVQDNLAILEARGVHLVPPDEGRLAGGDMGSGRLAAPETIYETVESILSDGDLQGRTVVVTAGGTREAIDPVRYVGNRSTGKQGYAVAEAAKARGANVTLISTVATAAPVGVEIVRVESARQMHAAVLERSDADVIVMAAAVADFRPVGVSESKIKKDAGPPKLELEATPDILAELGAKKK
ncbi:MAG: bifunctional phosphopantothenoylcysteine decarboxylase/phosphopantothenate--cysteine ligase CoaBC, partial [Actinomycetota bacterium]|nr:bifunctional phosphopantothenoylcysteine decarboxylase/phosphopantothenate--cysteine ligase CoaBC [Actinomycetota bacterium]